jgi:hypothetical protein
MDPDLLIVSGTSYIINNYVFPTTPTVNDIQVEGTVIAQITFLPKNSGGGLVYSKSSLLAPGDQPVTISHALVSISPTEPVLFFSRITDSPVFLQPVRPSTMRSIERPIPTTQGGDATSGNDQALPQRAPSLEGGSIAAIVICAFFALFLLILAIYMALRRRRSRMKAKASSYSEKTTLEKPQQPSDTTTVQSHDTSWQTSGFHTNKAELSATVHVYELDPSSTGPRELQAEVRLGSLAPHWKKSMPPKDVDRPRLGLDIPPVANRAVIELSPRSEAQRNRELQWLEMEEERSRRRREQVMQEVGMR